MLEGGGNVSVKVHIVRDTRQQMERGGPARPTAERVAEMGAERRRPPNYYHNLLMGRHNVLPEYPADTVLICLGLLNLRF